MFENQKYILFDDCLQLEAYQFDGVAQLFPNHFHEYFVIGLIETGERRLTVNNREYRIGPGDMITFNPMDNHACEQTDGGGLRYRCLNIKAEIMRNAVNDVRGGSDLPRFREAVQYRSELAPAFCSLHERIMRGEAGLAKEELFLVFIEQLFSNCADFTGGKVNRTQRQEIEDVCEFLQQHYDKRITLNMLSELARLNKYSLVRLFTRSKGITPYRYLENIRISEAKKLLEQGVEPSKAAQLTGFSDQSHFTAYFGKFIGVTPGQYQAIFREDTE